MKICSGCDEQGLHYEYHMTGPYDGAVFAVPHASSGTVQSAKLRKLRSQYPGNPVAFLLAWWASYFASIGFAYWLWPDGGWIAWWILGANPIWWFAWCWYDWCDICTRRLKSGDHDKCHNLILSELACYDARKLR